ncbi:thioredoxin family protein [bacterium]|nr:thioredoxin family protein [bacterium]MBU1994947.1 thioredoxin family protein [bacterium]
MKYILYFFILLGLSLRADTIAWYGNYDKAHQEAIKNKKMIMVLLVEENCMQCHKILQTTFMSQAYIRIINSLFVAVLITKGQKESYPIEMLYTMVYPSVFFLNTQELFVGKNIFGYVNPEDFHKYLDLHHK